MHRRRTLVDRRAEPSQGRSTHSLSSRLGQSILAGQGSDRLLRHDHRRPVERFRFERQLLLECSLPSVNHDAEHDEDEQENARADQNVEQTKELTMARYRAVRRPVENAASSEVLMLVQSDANVDERRSVHVRDHQRTRQHVFTYARPVQINRFGN